MNNESLFKVHKVGPSAPKFQFTNPCTSCGSHDHQNGGCSTAALHERRVRKIAEAEEEGVKLSAHKKWSKGLAGV